MLKLQDIVSASKVLYGRINKTPLLSFESVNKIVGAEVYFKAEIFQKTGSFKIRGVLNKLNSLSRRQKKCGVVAMSVGDHAISLAFAASILHIPCVIVMPKNVVRSKVEAAKKLGAKIIFKRDNLWAECLKMQQCDGLIAIHPFDDLYIIAGHGTIGLEILEDLPDVDVILVPIGGGGLISGVAAAVKLKKPKVKIIGVEPIGAPTMFLSLRAGGIIRLEKRNTIADGLSSPFVGKYTIALTKKYVDKIVLVSDEEIIKSMKTILRCCKILVEPSAAAAFAAILFRKLKIKAGAKIVCLLTGMNMGMEELLKLLGYKTI